MSKIVITTSSFGKEAGEILDLLRSRGFTVVLNPYGRALLKSEVLELCKDSVGIIAGTEKLEADTLELLARSADAANSLKVISRCGTGLDSVDLVAAKRLGIAIFNTPDAPTLAVAELTVGLMLDLMRKVSLMDRAIRRGLWEKKMGNLLSGKTVGIIGFGRIGRKVASLLHAFDCEIMFHDINDGATVAYARRAALPELLEQSDIISIHVSSRKQLIGHNELRMMKQGSWLINVARGGVVDEDALRDAIDRGHLAGAALDVFGAEPYTGPLKTLEQVILTPHIGSYAKEGRIAMEREAVENLLKGLGVGTKL
jgi:D-3-phosphoglycerate dehydrogenase / 2-oxoglutarate reductase